MSQKKIVAKWPINRWKSAQHHYSSRICKLEPQRDTCRHYYGIKFKSLPIPDVGKGMEKLEPSHVTSMNKIV